MGNFVIHTFFGGWFINCNDDINIYVNTLSLVKIFIKNFINHKTNMKINTFIAKKI